MYLLTIFASTIIRLQNKKSLLRISCETLRFRTFLEELLEDPDLVEIYADPELNGNVNLTYVLLYEFLAGAGLGRASPRLRGAIYKHTKAIHAREKILAQSGRGVTAIKGERVLTGVMAAIPRYARINTLKWTAEEALERLAYEEWKISYLSADENFAERVRKIAENEVLVDPHVKNLLIFPHSNEFHRYWLVEQRYLILQDKASCLPAFLLAPPRGSEVFDTCAAPGMKTSHVAAIMEGTGKIWAMDRSKDRVITMRTILRECGVENASVICGDFLDADVYDKRYAEVMYAIVDPPCSGSGMVKRMDELTGGNVQPERLSKLKNLQAMILKHALKFPNLQRAVYSTCSVHEEENEQVVDEVLHDTYVQQHFRLANSVLPSWNYRGMNAYKSGSNCLRADPSKTLTNGFFVAVFERLSNDGSSREDCSKKDKLTKREGKRRKKLKRSGLDCEEYRMADGSSMYENSEIKLEKCKKKRKKQD